MGHSPQLYCFECHCCCITSSMVQEGSTDYGRCASKALEAYSGVTILLLTGPDETTSSIRQIPSARPH